MQSFNEYNEHVNLNGPSVDFKGNILGPLRNEANPMDELLDNGDNDMERLEQIFNKLLAAGKINKQFLI